MHLFAVLVQSCDAGMTVRVFRAGHRHDNSIGTGLEPEAPMTTVTTIEQLEALYGAPSEPAIVKETETITPEYARYIEASPFVALATVAPGGLDCSPRGDKPGFVRIADDRTLMLPDRRGNNRIDSLRNILIDPRVALLCLIPGLGGT